MCEIMRAGRREDDAWLELRPETTDEEEGEEEGVKDGRGACGRGEGVTGDS